MNTPDTNPLDVLTNPDREAEKRELYERALEKTQAEQESKTTPDTEWEKLKVTIVEGKTLYINDYRVKGEKPWGGGEITYMAEVPVKDIPFIKSLLTSVKQERDTYWKERVRKEYKPLLITGGYKGHLFIKAPDVTEDFEVVYRLLEVKNDGV